MWSWWRTSEKLGSKRSEFMQGHVSLSGNVRWSLTLTSPTTTVFEGSSEFRALCCSVTHEGAVWHCWVCYSLLHNKTSSSHAKSVSLQAAQCPESLLEVEMHHSSFHQRGSHPGSSHSISSMTIDLTVQTRIIVSMKGRLWITVSQQQVQTQSSFR